MEAKGSLDIVELSHQFGHRIAFCGNMTVMEWAACEKEELKAIVLRKLNAAKDGGVIFQSDQSVPGNISAKKYEIEKRYLCIMDRFYSQRYLSSNY